MPTYEYECVECGHRFDAFQNMSDEALTECEHCKGPVKRLISGGAGIIFKGSGFYVTDNKGKSSAAGSSTSSKDKSDKSESSDTKTTAAKSESSTSGDSGGDKKTTPKKDTAKAK